MKLSKTTILGSCLLALSVSAAHAGPAVVGTFVADPGKTDLFFTMASCSKAKELVYGHTITLWQDGTFEQALDLDGAQPANPDLVLYGAWSEPKPGRIEMLYDGDVTEGATGPESWGWLITLAQQSLKPACNNLDIRLQNATVRVKTLTLQLNGKGKGDRGTLQVNIDSYGTGSSTRPGKIGINMKAKGAFNRDL
jgi:hypothetical protein